MSTLDLTAAETNVVAANTYVSQNDADLKVAFLPAVNDGSGATVAVDTEIRFEALAGGPIEIRTADGNRVGIVRGYTAACVVAQAGAAESEDDRWLFYPTPPAAAFQTISASPTQAEVEAVRNAVVNAGFMKAE